MPVKPITDPATILIIKGYVPPPDIYAPDIRSDDVIPIPPTFSQEWPDEFPANFNELPAEEQQKIKDRLRFRGIRLRGDLPSETVPITRETMDIP